MLVKASLFLKRYIKDAGKDVPDAEDNYVMPKEPTTTNQRQFERRRVGRPFNIYQHRFARPFKVPLSTATLLCNCSHVKTARKILYAFDSAHVKYGV